MYAKSGSVLGKAGLVLDIGKEEENIKKVVLALGVNDEIQSSSSCQTILAGNKALLDVRTAYPDSDIYFSSILPITGQKQAIVSSSKRNREVIEYLDGLAKTDGKLHYMNHTAHFEIHKAPLAHCTNMQP